MREREFNRSDVLDKAMGVFWEKGYYDTSIQDLVEQTNVARSGLYGEFGDKRALFLDALDRYQQQIADSMLKQLMHPDAGLKELREFFDSLNRLSSDKQRRQMGCLMCNTAIELAPYDEEVGQRVKSFFDRLRKTFRHAIDNGQASGEIKADIDSLAYGDYLTGIMQGLAVLSRSPVERTVIRRFISTALAQLD